MDMALITNTPLATAEEDYGKAILGINIAAKKHLVRYTLLTRRSMILAVDVYRIGIAPLNNFTTFYHC